MAYLCADLIFALQKPYVASCGACGECSLELSRNDDVVCSSCNGTAITFAKRISAEFTPTEEVPDGVDSHFFNPIYIPGKHVDTILGYDALVLYLSAEAEFELLLTTLVVTGNHLA